MSLEENLANRKWLLSRLRAEVVGPDPAGDPVMPLDPGNLPRMTWDEFRKPKKQVNGEEILWQDPPGKRYGAGILYPSGARQAEVAEQTDSELAASDAGPAPEPDDGQLANNETLQSRGSRQIDDSEDYDVTLANAFHPSAMGLSFLADPLREPSGFRVELACVGRLGRDEFCEQDAARYRKAKLKVGDSEERERGRYVWLRTPIRDGQGNRPFIDLVPEAVLGRGVVSRRFPLPNAEGLELVVVSRPWPVDYPEARQRLLTVSLVNRLPADKGEIDSRCVFQSGLRIRGRGNGKWIIPYPERAMTATDESVPVSEETINRLLYREYPTYAIGHGCAADWAGNPLDGLGEIWTDVLPTHETPSTTPDLEIRRPDGSSGRLRISMRKLAGLNAADVGSSELGELVDAYEAWINVLETNRAWAPPVPDMLQPTATELVRRCRTCLARIRDGLALLREDGEVAEHARNAFRLANHAMLIARVKSSTRLRSPVATADGRLTWNPPITGNQPAVAEDQDGYWRPFQIAFLLMSLRGICDPEHAERETVDLIWFPTGGGKTEAYLGLAAFTIFFNRLSGRLPGGSDVLMRYTLRLLTAQQFQRAALLFCAMEYLRRRDLFLGDKPFRLGLWVGGATTPNRRSDALHALGQLENDASAENPFILLKCPWCGARLGPNEAALPRGRRGRRGEAGEIPSVTGYYRHGTGTAQTVVYRCPDHVCEFGKAPPFGAPRDPLPVAVIDDDLVESPPNLLIGTVDKFAMLAWKPELRRFFGIGPSGDHDGEPPSLVIQDELHLISGPLGTMVGAYETVFERLCRQDGVGSTKPKIVASTATISHANEQVAHLYARDSVQLFPPSGLEAGDSFFARDERDADGRPKPGRLYAGVMAPGHISLQTTQARVFACLMQNAAIMATDDAGRDPWWTLLCFFNSLRELGGAATLFVADARDYLRVIIDRAGIGYERIRSPFATELTSRIRSDDIPRELARLELPFITRAARTGEGSASDRPVDVCLASNIIEVGVDIPRLSLMAIVGQPKTTSQYIQVSSRVGRDREKPGLVTILYGQSKPRDRSHYERFRSYHQRLYAQVEPTSVTPFSLPAVDRALHGIVLAAVRQLGRLEYEGVHPDPFPLAEGGVMRRLIEVMIRERVDFVTSGDETEAVMQRLQRRLDEWRAWNPDEYGGFGAQPDHPPLMYPAGATPPPQWNNHSWPTMSSLRDVDASCEADVTGWFNSTREEGQ